MNLLDGSPRLDHAFRSCGQRRAHRCQPIILSAASDLKWPFNLFCAVQQLTWTRGGGVIGASVHSDYSVESISNGEMKHRQWCPRASVEFPFLSDSWCGAAVSTGCALAKSAEPRSLPFTRSPSIQGLQPSPVGTVATELPTHSNSAARDKPAPSARTCCTWVNKRIRAKPVNCCQ